MKAQFSSCGKRSTKNQSEQLQQVAVGAMGLVCDEFGAHMLAAVAARVPSPNKCRITLDKEHFSFYNTIYQL